MRITLYMLVDGTECDVSALRQGSRFRPVETKGLDGVVSALYVQGSNPYAAKWVRELKKVAATDELDDLRVQSSSAVLLIKQDDVTFAVAFGGGYHAVEPTRIERGFGIRVTANAIAGTKIKSADTRGLNRDGRSQKVILPVASELGALGIEPTEEWVRQLSGTVKSQSFATTAAGADSLRLSIKDFSLLNLPEKLQQIRKFWQAKDYQAEFGFLDNFIRLDPKDPLVATLDSELTDLLGAESPDIYFAAPEPFEQLAVESYNLIRRKRLAIEDLSQEEIYAAMKKLDLPADDPLRKVTVEALNSEGGVVDKANKLYDYIQAEIPKDGARYVLSAGIWFRVANDYIKEVRDYLAGLEDLTDELDLPEWPTQGATKKYVDEGTYNAQVATAREYALLDKNNLQFGQHQKVEVCDLLTANRQLVCVKRASRSSTLSHLFSQGSVSASLMNEPIYQTNSQAPSLQLAARATSATRMNGRLSTPSEPKNPAN